ncbi:hypothetical protein SAMN02745164_00982 [Marinitoga hydrogenitolerans DSM 16785]|uniref:Fibronectin type-III domain-containing protein n=1 Tax=Marinitoga hydrogenitolerans (strain DSM 16785 / JCM 12826 / AT1271) TaxID=1122195 RepID=A0A1M4VPS3_MARH1|nr:hypothetical protein [Marinitoga hydrogenitolerans]SHE71054.1 hypothetical protein SAMN02745164_00982 [Marinitoga hydrogenitolerans DSM 16785]
MKKILILIFLIIMTYAYSNIIWEITPSNFEVIEYSTKITLKWDVNKKIIFSELYFGEKENKLKLIYKGDNNFFDVKDLIPNKNYYWKIKVYTKNEIYTSQVYRFYLRLKKPEIKNVYPNFQYNIDSEKVNFSWEIEYSIDYNTEFILYKNNTKIIDKRIGTNTYIIELSPGINYKWYLKLKDKFNNKYIFGPYIFSTKAYEFIMNINNEIYKIKTYGEYIEKESLYISEYKIEKIQKHENFIILKTKKGIDIIHKTGKLTSEISIKNILDFSIEKKDTELLLYITDGKALYVFDITNPYYPFLKKEILGEFVSVSVNNNIIILLTKNKLVLMDKELKIYYQKNIEKPKKIIYNDDNTLIITLSDKLIKYNYKNGIVNYEKELTLSKIIDWDIYKDKIAFLTINDEIYVYNINLELTKYRYIKSRIEKIKLYKNLVYYYYDNIIRFIE